MRLGLAMVAMLALLGCNRAAEDAEHQFDMVRQTKPHTYADLCSASSKAVDAWLAAGDQKKYEDWKSRHDMYCDLAARSAALGMNPVDEN